MTDLRALVQTHSHRPWPMPAGRWVWYQEWNRVLFLHWRVPVEVLQPLIPRGLELDRFDGDAWVSLVPFTMNRIRPRGLPAVSFVSDFDEVNLRTYVTDGTKAGVYFLSIHAGSALAAWLARTLSGLPYRAAQLARSIEGGTDTYRLQDDEKAISLDARFRVTPEPVPAKTAVERWLTERYCLYTADEASLYRYEIHHVEWPLQRVELVALSHSFRVGDLALSERPPELCHYSPGVRVVAWPRVKAGANRATDRAPSLNLTGTRG
jgi:uncharacterized protein YqjF (DUF2071 family)